MTVDAFQQDDLMLPLLMELSIRGGRVEIHRGSSGMDDVQDCLALLLKTNPRDWGTVKNGQNRFRNWIQWAKKELMKNGYVTGAERIDWRITESGYGRLRTLIKEYVSNLGHRDKAHADRFLFDLVDSCDFSRFNLALRLLDPSDLHAVVYESPTPHEMFCSAIDRISNSCLSEVILWSYEDIGRHALVLGS